MDALNPRGHRWRRRHRVVALIGLVAVLCFGLSGLLHPLLTRLQPRPAASAPPAAAPLPAGLAVPAQFLPAAGIARVQGLRLVARDGGWGWRAEASGEVRWFDAATGMALPVSQERDEAIRLARHYTGLPTASVKQAERLTAFDTDYPRINRLLPVWRVTLDTPRQLTAYVLPEEGRLATLSDDRKRVLQQLFSTLHTWKWLPKPARGFWIDLLLAGLLATIIAGLALRAGSPGGRRWNLRRLHRTAAPLLAVFALAWTVSGFVQTLDGPNPQGQRPSVRALDAHAAALTALVVPPADTTLATLVQLGGAPVWRFTRGAADTTAGQGLAMGEHQHSGHRPQAVQAGETLYLDAASGAPLGEAEARQVAELVRLFGGTVAPATLVTRFSPEYGFANKRLPVWRVEQPDADHTALFIDAEHERLAARVTDSDRFTGALFAYAHKWEWVTPLAGKDARDGLAALAVVLLMATALGGALLGRRRVRNARRRCTVSPPAPESS